MNILIAEDDYVTRMILKTNLRPTGHRIIEAGDGEQAWELYMQHRPEMIITDWMMPETDGLELCRRIRGAVQQHYSYLIVLTSKDEISDLVKVFDAGADDYITKPVVPDELTSRIKTGQRVVDLEKKHYDMQAVLIEKNRELDRTLSELKLTHSKMIQTEKMASIGQLSAGVAHEINNPIGFIGGNLDALADYLEDVDEILTLYQRLLEDLQTKEKDRLSEDLARQVSTITEAQERIDLPYIRADIPDLLKDCKDGTMRISGIVKDLKQFARPGDPGQTLVDINAGLRSTLNVIHNEIKYKAGVEIDLGDIDPILGYPQKLNQVFMNILINAGQSMENKGMIAVNTRQDDSHAIISISDNGCGIEKDNLTKVFDPFYSTKDVGQGTGLGLTSAYDIVKEHGGSIEVSSRVGQGTCFTILLPRHPNG